MALQYAGSSIPGIDLTRVIVFRQGVLQRHLICLPSIEVSLHRSLEVSPHKHCAQQSGQLHIDFKRLLASVFEVQWSELYLARLMIKKRIHLDASYLHRLLRNGGLHTFFVVCYSLRSFVVSFATSPSLQPKPSRKCFLPSSENWHQQPQHATISPTARSLT